MTENTDTAELFDTLCELVDAPESFSRITIELNGKTNAIEVSTYQRYTDAVVADRTVEVTEEEQESLTEGDDEGWPQRDPETDEWVDVDGVTYDEEQHAWNREDDRPSVKNDGTFRKKINRSGGSSSAASSSDTQSRGFSPVQIAEAVENNVVLGALQTHILAAPSNERLTELANRPEVTMLSDQDRAIVEQLIAQRREALAN